jgi:hypothetical protein
VTEIARTSATVRVKEPARVAAGAEKVVEKPGGGAAH